MAGGASGLDRPVAGRGHEEAGAAGDASATSTSEARIPSSIAAVP